ncbi:hypothetical protein [Prescottella equi]|uniref:hypothetical protein n=1 Tax=Rhodococcus hoagii TaxID=43767 RepID=UPI001EEC9AE5|nr:hypothetical protein [Prescottella equi]
MTMEEAVAAALREKLTDQSLDGQLWGAFPNTMTVDDLAAHIASTLHAAGIGTLADAYKHAADVVHAEARWQWERDMQRIPGAQIVAQRMSVIEDCIRHFANESGDRRA